MEASNFSMGSSPKNHFSIVANSLIRDRSLTDGAFRVICWIGSHAEGFVISFEGIRRSLGYGRDKLRTILSNAEETGYLVRVKNRDAKTGRFSWKYFVFMDKREAVEFKKSIDGFSGGGSPTSGSPTSGKPTPNKEEYKEEKQTKKIEFNFPPISPQGEGEEESVDEAVREVEVVEEDTPTPPVAPLSPNKSAIARKDNSGKEPSSAARFLIEKSVQERLLTQWEAGELQTPLPREQHAFLAHKVMGDYIRAYRKSGTLKSANPNDYDPEFIEHCANKHLSGRIHGSLAKARAMIRRKEQDPYTWGELLEYVRDWMAVKEREVFDEEGNPVTGLAAECAEAIATNSLLQTILEIDLND